MAQPQETAQGRALVVLLLRFLQVGAGAEVSLVLPVELHDPVVHGLDQAQDLLVLVQPLEGARAGCREQDAGQSELHP